MSPKFSSIFIRTALLIICTVSVLCSLRLHISATEKLPLKTYSSADGLASSVIHHIMRDSQGFLWFSARGGLSRFDGYEFTTYRIDDSESSPLVHMTLEARDGTFWIATDSGLYRVERREIVNVQPMTQTVQDRVRRLNAKKVLVQAFWALFEEDDGTLLGGSSTGLYVIENKNADKATSKGITYNKTARSEHKTGVRNFAKGKDGSLWAASDAGLLRRLPDGRWITYDVPRIVSIGNEAFSVLNDSMGRVWITFRSGVFILYPEPIEALNDLPDLTALSLPVEELDVGIVGAVKMPANSGKMFKLKFAESTEKERTRAGQAITAMVEDLYQTADGKIWIPTKKSLYIFDGDNYRRLKDSNSLPGSSRRIVEDIQGNLWFGTFSGAVKYARNGLTTYNQSSGLLEPNIYLEFNS